MKRISYTVLISLICVASIDAADNHKLSAPPTWNLKYKSGSFQLKKEQWVKGGFAADATVQKQRNPIVVISSAQVRAIYFNPKAQQGSDLMQHMPRSGCGYANSLMPKDDSARGPAAFLAWIESPGPISRAAEHLNARYPVGFVWNDGSSEGNIVLSVNYCEYASFLANVRWFIGARWYSVGREFPK